MNSKHYHSATWKTFMFIIVLEILLNFRFVIIVYGSLFDICVYFGIKWLQRAEWIYHFISLVYLFTVHIDYYLFVNILWCQKYKCTQRFEPIFENFCLIYLQQAIIMNWTQVSVSVSWSYLLFIGKLNVIQLLSIYFHFVQFISHTFKLDFSSKNLNVFGQVHHASLLRLSVWLFSFLNAFS